MTGPGPPDTRAQVSHGPGNMVGPGLVLLATLCSILLGAFVWAISEHFLTTDVPSTLRQPAKLRFLHCLFLSMVTLVSRRSGPTMGWDSLCPSLCPLPLFFLFHLPCLSLFRLFQERQTLPWGGGGLSSAGSTPVDGGSTV